MNLQYRIGLLIRLGEYILADGEEWQAVKDKASRENGWFIVPFIDLSSRNIASSFLTREALEQLAAKYDVPEHSEHPKKTGIIMAGNIPLVGFHDFLCVFLAGHHAVIKPSSKDDVLIRHLAAKMVEWDDAAAPFISFAEMLKGCDAYIATGSNNSAGHFEFYFRKYPSIIRRNRTSVAILDGTESDEELSALADDVHLYFGLGCRNVTSIAVPEGYDFVPLLTAFRKYNYMADHHKYKNNYDYNLAIHLLNHDFYMTNDSILVVENPSLFSPISQLNYTYYKNKTEAQQLFAGNDSIQCIAGHGFIPFGKTQQPAIDEYADGVDTMAFLRAL